MSTSDFSRLFQILRAEGVRGLVGPATGYLLNRLLSTPNRIRLRAFRYRCSGHPGIGNPLRVYTVSADDLHHCITRSEFSEPTAGFTISSGSWDRDAIPIEEFPLYIMCKRHFEEGVAWEETERFRKRKATLESDGSFGELDLDPDQQSLDAYREYLEYLDFLYESIEQEGYKRQSELGPDADFVNRERQHPALGEIELFIGRDGTLIAGSGLHRLCIAKLLDVEILPVRTHVRHRAFQEIRDEIATTPREELSERAKRTLSHPEIADLV